MILKLRNDQVEDVVNIWYETNAARQSYIDDEYWKANIDIFKHGVLSNAETYVCVEADEVIGFVSILDGQYISALVVKLSQEGKGVGSELLSYCMKNYKNLHTSVFENNEKGKYFLEKNGFIEHLRKNDDETGFCDIIYTWER